MRARTRLTVPEANPDWIRSSTWNGLTQRTEFQVSTEPGWFRFIEHVHVTSTGDEWVTCYGGRDGRSPQRKTRSFQPSKIKVRRGAYVTRPHRADGDE